MDDQLISRFFEAAFRGHTRSVQYFLDRGESIEATDTHGKTALIIATTYNHLELSRLLLDRGASIEAIDNYDNTSLAMAVTQGHYEVVKLLLDRGVSAETANTSLIYAEQVGYSDIVDLVKKARDREGRASVGMLTKSAVRRQETAN